MSWITDDWRLKLLALGLAILLLGAVAFSQNPPTAKTLQLPLHYTTVGSDPSTPLVILTPPSTVGVTFLGPADVIGNANQNNFSATVDATHAVKGPAVKLSISVTTTINVAITNPAPIVVRVDDFVEKDLPVAVATRAAPGWAVDQDQTNATPATVRFTGPASWETNITASVVIGAPVAATNQTLLNQPVQLTNSNGALSVSPCTTVPCPTLDPANVAVKIVAHTGTTSTTVPLVADTPSQPPPAGYQITSWTVNPVTVIITGDPIALGKVQRIMLPKVDLSGATTTTKFTVQITFPAGTSPLNGVQTASITYTIQKEAVSNPSPSPSP